MKTLNTWLPKLGFLLMAGFLITMAVRSHNDTTLALVVASVFMFAACWANATHLLGVKPALLFVALAMGMGWFAEQMGSTRGWFFGSYSYTAVLGWRLGDVPAIIPMMWFALCYVGYLLANFCIWQRPLATPARLPGAVFLSFLAAALVTAYDLGADPYMVYVLKAWIMTEKDGWWFGETLEGFAGWVFVAFVIISTFRLLTRKQALQVGEGYAKWQALLPFLIYGFSMVFQMLKGHPVETRTIALFAMGIPLLIGLAGWWRWDPDAVVDVDGAGAAASGVADARLAHLQYAADPHADDAITAMLGDAPPALNGQAPGAAALAQHLALIGQVNQQLGTWTTNGSLQAWQPGHPGLPTAVTQALQTYLQQGQALPQWADASKIARAEALFMDYGALSCTLLFCASLPECYVVPDLSAVLHAAGQLEAHTEHRIRATAAMIFPVMLRGGLTTPDGSGVAQILKVRLIHATIRHLILHGSPAHALAADKAVPGQGLTGLAHREGDMYETLLNLGWNVPQDGLPCNQEELAYTLLTFGYVFLRSMRRLGLGLPPADEEAYLHAWNVVGHVLGIRRELMADTMAQAAALFGQLQALGRAHPYTPDPRPPLGEALMATMESVIPFKVMKAFPTLLTRHLCGHNTADAIGVDTRVSWLSKALFALLMALAGTVDNIARLFVPGFSLTRLLTRVLGYHFMSRVLMDQTRPLKLPSHLLNQVGQTLGGWGDDPKAPGWVNQLEDRLTKPGQWRLPESA